MRIVLDTNVLVAAFIAHGNCNELLEHCAVHHEIILSKHILDEFQKVLVRKFDFTQAEARTAAHLLRSRARLVSPSRLPEPACRDREDDTILATALAGRCTAIVSGDKELRDLQTYQGVMILSPSEFWEFESRTGEQGS
jgi:uncharacterized protein